jgi:hypothetical protein
MPGISSAAPAPGSVAVQEHQHHRTDQDAADGRLLQRSEPSGGYASQCDDWAAGFEHAGEFAADYSVQSARRVVTVGQASAQNIWQPRFGLAWDLTKGNEQVEAAFLREFQIQ